MIESIGFGNLSICFIILYCMLLHYVAMLLKGNCQLRARQAGTSAVQFGDPVPVSTNEVTVMDTGETQMRRAEIGIPYTDIGTVR